ncbi:Hypothetical protein NTJ_12507 [Nesidiocoris tenuis]|uniref:Reverse transcriptase domain-containing protein n=1 Tax=Nesidiocoris tenuis TaxID=355587 RepID=A0ABN7B908_9HEMI|nr:Hypothetical protein NTJ_12507 [Nesidiocoris tenuis]
MANNNVDWNRIKALLARRAVALDKCPGVRPIGVSEVLQRICAKAMAWTTGDDLKEACGSDQLSAGLKSGIEGAIHSMSAIFEEDQTECILLVDARNAFNQLSRPLALWNARIFWSRCARFLFNSYRGYPLILFRQNNAFLLSREGTTQGDPLGAMMYAVGTLQLIKELKSPNWKQMWYADDSSCAGSIARVREWFNSCYELGPKWGYIPEPEKSFLIVKAGLEEEARAEFQDLDVQIVPSHRFLGGVIGPVVNKRAYVQEKVEKWSGYTIKLAKVAKKSPQAVHAVVTKSFQHEWGFLQRVTGGFTEEYKPLQLSIQRHLMPAILGREITELETELLTLPARLGGLGINDPVTEQDEAHRASQQACALLIEALREGTELNYANHLDTVAHTIKEERVYKNEALEQRRRDLVTRIEEENPRLARIQDRVNGNSQWLTIVPSSADGFDLDPIQFRDALAMRYGHTPQNLPSSCDGCGAAFDLNHALNCKKGGLVKRGHDSVRDDCLEIAKLVWGGAVREPVLRNGNDGSPELVADMKLQGVWDSVRPAFFDHRIINADAASHSSRTWNSIAESAAREKHMKYDQAAEDKRGSFSPLICSCDGALHREYGVFQKRMAQALATKWEKPYSAILGWVRVRTQLSIIRATSMRLRNGRSQVKALGLEDGAGLPSVED